MKTKEELQTDLAQELFNLDLLRQQYYEEEGSRADLKELTKLSNEISTQNRLIETLRDELEKFD